MNTSPTSSAHCQAARPDWREVRRLRVLALHQKGWSQTTIAVALDLSQGRDSQILKCAREQGEAALRSRRAQGAQAKLTAAQQSQVLDWLCQGATACGFAGDVWTSVRIAQLIQQKLGVTYHAHHIPKLLRAWGWSPQKPIVRATQRDEAKIADWVDHRWPMLKKS